MSNSKYNRIIINVMNNNLENIDILINRIYNIFNKCSEEIQIDFIKLLFISNKSDVLSELEINNIYTIKKLLEWGCNNNNLQLCKFVLNHKSVILDNVYYYSLEEIIKGNNSELVSLINYHRIKDTYQTDSDTDETDEYDDTTDFFETSSESSIFSSDDDSSTNDIKYGKDITQEEVIDVD